MSSPSWFSICFYFLLVGLPCAVLSFIVTNASSAPLPLTNTAFLLVFFFGLLIGLLPAYFAAMAFWVVSRIYLKVCGKTVLQPLEGFFFGLLPGFVAAFSFGLLFGDGIALPKSASVSYFFSACAVLSGLCGALASTASELKKT